MFVAAPLAAGTQFVLPAAAARHVQVLRLQPGDAVCLFDGGSECEWAAEIMAIGRRDVEVRIGAARAVDRELPWRVTLALAPPANDRMDALIEKAGELGAAAVQPLLCERSVLRLAGERAEAKRAHWQGVAAAASEQCGRVRVTHIEPVMALTSWLDGAPVQAGAIPTSVALPPVCRIVLSLAAAAVPPAEAFAGIAAGSRILVLSGPEGGLTPAEEQAATAQGFLPVSLGPRTLRADTAPLAVLGWLALRVPG